VNPELEAVIKEIIAITKQDERRDDEFTVREFRELGQFKCTATAARQLNRLVKCGMLEVRKTRINGVLTGLYKETDEARIARAKNKSLTHRLRR